MEYIPAIAAVVAIAALAYSVIRDRKAANSAKESARQAKESAKLAKESVDLARASVDLAKEVSELDQARYDSESIYQYNEYRQREGLQLPDPDDVREHLINNRGYREKADSLKLDDLVMRICEIEL